MSRARKKSNLDKYHKQLSKLREKALEVSHGEAVVGFFGGEHDLMPMSKVHVIVVDRGTKARNYPHQKQKTRPCRLSSLPMIWHEGNIVIGGRDWHVFRHRGMMQYAQKEVPGSRPVGVAIDLLTRHADHELCLKLNPFKFNEKVVSHHLKMLKWGLRMLDEDHCEQQPGYIPAGAKQLHLPYAYCTAEGRSKLRLRYGDALDQRVLDCVNNGRWGIRYQMDTFGSVAPSRGSVKRQGSEVLFGSDYGGDPSHFTAQDVSWSCEEMIDKLFGKPVRVELMPTLVEGDHRVAINFPLFAPAVPAGTFHTIAQLEEAAGSETVETYRYLVALTTLREVNNLPAIDAEYAFGGDEPFVDVSAMRPRIQKIQWRSAIRYRDELYNVDLGHFAQRDYVHALLTERSRLRRAAKAEKERVSDAEKVKSQEPEPSLEGEKGPKPQWNYKTPDGKEGAVEAADEKAARAEVRKILKTSRLPAGTEVVQPAKV